MYHSVVLFCPSVLLLTFTITSSHHGRYLQAHGEKKTTTGGAVRSSVVDHRSKYKQINVLLLLQEQTPSLLVTVNTHHLLPACLRCLLLLIVRVLTQFPIATSRTKRESFRWQIIMKDISFPFSASTSVDHRRRRYLFCSPELHTDERCQGWVGEGPAREGRLLHMSVAMGILAQWLCSNAAAGTEDLFSQGRHWWEKKKAGEKKWSVHELEPQPPIMWQGHLF